MPTLYTAFFDSHTYGCPVARPMFFTFPTDTATWNVNTQFMIGDGLLVAPCLEENGTSVEVYFPQGTWYSLYDYAITDASTAPRNKSLEVRVGLHSPWEPRIPLCLGTSSLIVTHMLLVLYHALWLMFIAVQHCAVRVSCLHLVFLRRLSQLLGA